MLEGHRGKRKEARLRSLVPKGLSKQPTECIFNDDNITFLRRGTGQELDVPV